MATYYAKNAGSVLAANAWNTADDGSGSDATFADGDATGHTLDLNALAMTAPDGTTLTCTLLVSGQTNSGGTFTPTGAVTIAGKVKYTHTSTGGMIPITTGDTLTITCSEGAGVNAVENTSTGYVIVAGGSATLIISNSGGTALSNSSSGRAISSVTTGTITITGAVLNSSSGYCVYHLTGAATITITGTVTATSSGASILFNAGAVTIVGKIISGRENMESCAVVVVGTGTFNWKGSYTYTSEFVGIKSTSTGTTINLGTGSEANALSITNASSVVLINGFRGTVNTDNFAHTRTTTASQFAFIYASGFTDTGPTIPAEEDVESGVEYGYSGDLQTGILVPTTPTYFII